jgi:two-component system, NarL family, nitrate/nitrite response regulator NarL
MTGTETPAGARVLVVDDHDLFVQALVLALRLEGFGAEGVPATDRESVMAAVEGLEPRVVLLDIALGPEQERGTALIQPVRERGAAVIVVTALDDREEHAACFEAGALSVIHKSTSMDRLVVAAREALEMRSVQSKHDRDELLTELYRNRAARVEQTRPFERLTPREQQVLAALVEGKTAEMIAAHSTVSITTVRSQIQSLLLKLGVRTQLGAVALARQAGWTPP